MNASTMLELMNRIPFGTFEVHLNNGAVVEVDEPYSIATRPNAPTFIYYAPDESGMRIVSYRNVAEVKTTASSAD